MGKPFAATTLFVLIGFSLAFVADEMKAESSAPSAGLEGVISVSPIHGGPTRVGVPDSAPLANVAFDVLNDAGAVTSFTTDSSGQFRVALAPGHYSVKLHDSTRRFPRCGPFEVEVTSTGFKKVEWQCDTGMR